MSKVSVIAQNVMDQYYRAYKSEEDFFELYHFKYIVSIAYAAIVQSEYEKSYYANAQETGNYHATINADWFKSEMITVVRNDDDIVYGEFVGKLSCPVFNFKFDRSSSGIKNIFPAGSKCKDFIRINVDEVYKMDLLPPSPEVYWFELKDKIYFTHVSCGLSKAVVLYIPRLDDIQNEDATIPVSMEMDVFTMAFNIMSQAREGKRVIDVTMDNNPNAELQTEINNLFDKMRR